MLKLWLSLILLNLAFSIGEIRQLQLSGRSYQGFIYPYIITYNPRSKSLHFDTITSTSLLLGSSNPSMALQPSYQLFPVHYSLQLDSLQFLKINPWSICLRNSTQLDGKFNLLLRNPHLALHHQLTAPAFPGIFELTTEYLFRLFTRKYKIQELFRFQVGELGADFICVYMLQDAETFTMFLKRRVTQDVSDIEQYRFKKEYVFGDRGDLQDLVLVRSTKEEVLEVGVWGRDRYCVFKVVKKQGMRFGGCETIGGEEIIKVRPFQKDYVMIHSRYQEQPEPNKNTTAANSTSQASNEPSPPATNNPTPSAPESPDNTSSTSPPTYRHDSILITSHTTNPPSSCSFRYTNDPIVYTNTLEHYAVICTKSSCQFIDSKCQVVHHDMKIESKDQLERIDLVRFRVENTGDQISDMGEMGGKIKYVSQLVIRMRTHTETRGFCLMGELEQQMLDAQGELVAGQYYCVPQPSSQPAQSTPCDNLPCFQCSLTPYCYFLSGKCQQIMDKPVVLFPKASYENPYLFQHLYAQYLSGQSSTCPINAFSCSLQKQTITSTVTIKTSTQPKKFEYCTIMVQEEKDAYYRLNFPDNGNYSVRTSMGGEWGRDSQIIWTREDGIGIYYAILYIFFTGENNITEQTEQVGFTITNLEEQQIYYATKLFTTLFGGFLIFSLVLLTFFLFKNRLFAQLALWGIIPFTPSNSYPLSDLQLKLKLRELLRKSFILQYNFSSSASMKQLHQCSFCLEQFTENEPVFEIYCRHKYHKSCLSEWIKKEKNSGKCPICKRGFTDGELLRFNENSYSYGLSQSNP